MSGIVLSAAVRQNLLSLQSTASLLATTQNDLATGNKVNSALDNPTEYFTAQGLNNRASDINNLLDSINNGVQVLQAANTGITSLQSLVASAQSIANQVLQAPVGYSTKSQVTAAAITGANANNLLGTGGFNATAIEAALQTGGNSPATVSASTLLGGTAGALTGSAANANTSTAGTTITLSPAGTATASTALSSLATAITAGTLTVNGKTITFQTTALSAPTGAAGNVDSNLQTDGSGNSTINTTGATFQDVLDAIDIATGAQTASVTGGVATLKAVAGKNVSTINSSGQIVVSNSTTTAITEAAGTSNAFTQLGLPASVAAAAAITTASDISKLGSTSFAAGDSLTVGDHTVSFVSSAPTTGYTKLQTAIAADGTASGNVYVGTDGNVQVVVGQSTPTTIGDVMSAIDIASGVQSFNAGTGAASLATGQTASSIATGKLTLESTTGASLTVTASNSQDLKALGLSPDSNGSVTAKATAASTGIGTLIADGSTLNVDGKTITFVASLPATVPTGSGKVGNVITDGNGNSTVSLSGGSIQDVLNAIDLATGVQTASITNGVATLSTASGDTNSTVDANGKLNISTGTTQNLVISAGHSGNALAALGLTAGTTADSSLQGETLNIAATPGGGTVATSITFGTGAGQISTLNQLNSALAANNLQASIDTTGAITITTTNNAASQTLGALSGTSTATGQAFAGLFAAAPVVDPNSQATRASLVNQYNQVMQQITTTAQDSSFNGINLLNGDTLNLTFDETGASKLSITGVTFNTTGLGLSTLSVGTDFLDNNSANSVLATLTQADTTLRTEASALGSNLSVVQIRQDFNKNLINVLQTGASNLTLADPNEEAANSQALSTRQSIAVSALALANQSQQSVLQLLR